MTDHFVLTLDVCPVCGLVSGQLAWDVPTVAGECAGAVCLGTDHEPAQMERGNYGLLSGSGGRTMEGSTNRGRTALTADPRTTGGSAP